MAAGESSRARRARGQGPRGARPQAAGAAEIVAPRKVLDARAARLVAGDLLSRRAWTAADLAARLARRGAPREVAAAVVADLIARGDVDDAAFARHWVAARAARGYGAARLRAELHARGVAAPLIDVALAAVAPDELLARAREIARRRLPALRRDRPERVAARLRDHLLRRGFAVDLAATVVRELLEAAPDG